MHGKSLDTSFGIAAQSRPEPEPNAPWGGDNGFPNFCVEVDMPETEQAGAEIDLDESIGVEFPPPGAPSDSAAAPNVSAGAAPLSETKDSSADPWQTFIDPNDPQAAELTEWAKGLTDVKGDPKNLIKAFRQREEQLGRLRQEQGTVRDEIRTLRQEMLTRQAPPPPPEQPWQPDTGKLFNLTQQYKQQHGLSDEDARANATAYLRENFDRDESLRSQLDEIRQENQRNTLFALELARYQAQDPSFDLSVAKSIRDEYQADMPLGALFRLHAAKRADGGGENGNGTAHAQEPIRVPPNRANVGHLQTRTGQDAPTQTAPQMDLKFQGLMQKLWDGSGPKLKADYGHNFDRFITAKWPEEVKLRARKGNRA